MATNTDWSWQSVTLGPGTNDLQWFCWGSCTDESAETRGYVDEVVITIPPVITQPPINQTVFIGQTARYSVAATGTPSLNYQWRCNGAPIPGATESTLTLNAVQAAQAGRYAVVVSNPAGSVTNADAVLTVLPPPAGPGSVDLTFDPTAGGRWIGLTGGSPLVKAVLQQPDGKVLIGRLFNGVSSSAVIKRLLRRMSFRTWFY